MAIKKIKGMQWLFTLLKVGLAGSLITWLIASGKFDLSSLQKIKDPMVWLVSLSLFSICLLLNTKRWQLFLSFESLHEPFRKLYTLSLIGIFFNFVIPGGVGGDVVKAGYLIKDHTEQRWFVGWSALIDRIFGMSSLLIIASITGLFSYKQVPQELQNYILTFSLTILIGFSIGLTILLVTPLERVEKFFPKENLMKKVFYTPFYFFKVPSKVLAPFVISILSQCFNIGIFYSFALLTGVDIPWWVFSLLVPIGMLSVILPIAPAGLGVGQTSFYYLFEKVAGVGEFGVLVITFVQITQFIIGCIGGILFVLYNKKIGKAEEAHLG